ncbi:MAG TPA: hypothetical protein VKM72_03350 [Thermoanaerobaculia bacterium]|nr:hypothetical protein [Thermoanaerobaculia bacterium]
MKNIARSTSLLASLVAVTLLTGCGSTGILGGGSSDNRSDRNSTYDPYEQRVDNVRGTVQRVDTRERIIVVDREDTGYNNNLRNGSGTGEVVLSYDDRTTVVFQGKTFRPEDLERGDRILAEVASGSRLSNDRLLVNEIQVLYDVSGGVGDTGGYDNGGTNNSTRNLRGTVRYVDTRNRTVEVDTYAQSQGFSAGSTGSSGSTTRSGVVLVHYDAQTVVEFQGRRYQPENLERGDEVEIDARTISGQLVAEEILVVRDAQSR